MFMVEDFMGQNIDNRISMVRVRKFIIVKTGSSAEFGYSMELFNLNHFRHNAMLHPSNSH